MRVFVTGGNGFLGSRTLNQLVLAGYRARCLLRKESKIDRIRHLPFETHYGDVRDLGSLTAGIRGCDAVIHLACISSWQQIREQADQLETISVGGTENVLRAGFMNGKPRIVYISSCAAINASSTPIIFDEKATYTLGKSNLRYSLVKHLAEQVVHSYVLRGMADAVIVNPSEIYGPYDDGLVTAGNIIEILKSVPPISCAGGTAIAHVDDVARGIVLALQKGRQGERYILGGENLTIAELTRRVRRFAGKSERVVTVPNGLLVGINKFLSTLHLPTPIPMDVLDYATLYWFMDSSKAKNELGYTWRSANQTIQNVMEWLLETKRVA